MGKRSILGRSKHLCQLGPLIVFEALSVFAQGLEHLLTGSDYQLYRLCELGRHRLRTVTDARCNPRFSAGLASAERANTPSPSLLTCAARVLYGQAAVRKLPPCVWFQNPDCIPEIPNPHFGRAKCTQISPRQ